MGIRSVADSSEVFGCEVDGVSSCGDFDPKDLDFPWEQSPAARVCIFKGFPSNAGGIEA
jgi:hypothetical protein